MTTMRGMVVAAAVLVVMSTPGSRAADDCPPYSDDLKAVVYQSMKADALVRDVHIGQDGCDLTLAVVVSAATSELGARELGDRFVRLTKSFGPGPVPAQFIGKGIYNYTVGVFTAAEKRLAMGAKARGATGISW